MGMGNGIRMSRQTVAVLVSLLAEPTSWRYGYDLSRETGLKSGTLYPILMRLTADSWLQTRWEEAEPGRPPRHMYRLTTNGLRQARQFVTEAKARGFVPCLAPEEGRA
jgi:PadR family transcriptional regulator, regulatory protein PadR